MREPADRLVSQVSQARTRIIATLFGHHYFGRKAMSRGLDDPRIGAAGYCVAGRPNDSERHVC